MGFRVGLGKGLDTTAFCDGGLVVVVVVRRGALAAASCGGAGFGDGMTDFSKMTAGSSSTMNPRTE